MGIVTDYLRIQISKQVDDNGIVVWYDPEKHYAQVANQINPPNTHFVQYQNSFFALRQEIDHLLNDLHPPRLLVYVPIEPTATKNALVELESAGIIMKPGQQPPQRNTRLSVIARNALKPIVGEETVETITKQIEASQLTLTDLDTWSEDGGITKGVVSVIFGTGNPQDVALAFLSSDSASRDGGDRYDAELTKREAVPELIQLLNNTFETNLPSGEPLNALRTRLSRHILTTDLLCGLQGNIPEQLHSIKIPPRTAAREACLSLAKTWRLRRDLGESYVTQSNHIQNELGLTTTHFRLEQILQVETFVAIETALQQCVEIALVTKPTTELVQIAHDRQAHFWSEQLPDIQAHWALIAVAGNLLLEAKRIESSLKNSSLNAKAIFNAYIHLDQPWCLLDTYHRHLERRWHDFDTSLHECRDSLDQLVNSARSRYMKVGGDMAEAFVRSYQQAKFRLPGVLLQREIFEHKVKPDLGDKKIAYIWVDALRYEMARELVQTLKPDYDLEIQAAIATVPTITEIGMAALLPGADTSAEVVQVAPSKLGLKINHTIIKDREGRIKFLQDSLQATTGQSIFSAKLHDLLPKPKKKIQDGIQDAKLILITSQEIDDIGEKDHTRLARLTMDSILHELKRGFQVLANLGVETIVVAADHGHLFGEELTEGMKINAPGGETADLHRRVWVGKGGNASSNYLRASLSEFGLTSEFELVTPWNFACFKVQGGGDAYFHGGLSPQELIIPVVTLQPKQLAGVGITSEINWTLTPGSQKISTRFFSVQIKGTASSLFELIPPKVRLEIRSPKKTVISRPISASYGFEDATGDIQLQLAGENSQVIEPDTVTLMMMDSEPLKATVSIHLLHAVTGVELARPVKIEMAITL